MKVKTADLIDAALDWAVAKCEGENEEAFCLFYEPTEPTDYDAHGYPEFHYSTIWAQGGPIIERECMDILCLAGGDDGWQADKYLHTEQVIRFGPTPLIAAMRCLVASRLGDEVEVPDELMK